MSPHGLWLEGKVLQVFVGNKVERRVKLECKLHEGKMMLVYHPWMKPLRSPSAWRRVELKGCEQNKSMKVGVHHGGLRTLGSCTLFWGY